MKKILFTLLFSISWIGMFAVNADFFNGKSYTGNATEEPGGEAGVVLQFCDIVFNIDFSDAGTFDISFKVVPKSKQMEMLLSSGMMDPGQLENEMKGVPYKVEGDKIKILDPDAGNDELTILKEGEEIFIPDISGLGFTAIVKRK